MPLSLAPCNHYYSYDKLYLPWSRQLGFDEIERNKRRKVNMSTLIATLWKTKTAQTTHSFQLCTEGHMMLKYSSLVYTLKKHNEWCYKLWPPRNPWIYVKNLLSRAILLKGSVTLNWVDRYSFANIELYYIG